MAIEAKHTSIRSLIMGDLNQFHIPIYQRTYTWKASIEVDKLIKDIIEFGIEYKENANVNYYIGNIIVKNQSRAMMIERIVIDGQQRITTTVLILCAVRDVYLNKIKTDEARRAAKQIGKSLLLDDDDGNVKVKLNNMEHQNTLVTLLTGAISTISLIDKDTNYWKNYQYIYKKFILMDAKDFDYFVTLLDRVVVVIIFLDNDQDENSVFESINSKGKALSGSDLIKNFLFTFKNYQCSHSEEQILTDIYTKNFESLFVKDDSFEKSIEDFYREYLALKTQIKVNNDPKIIYYSFKKMIGDINGFEECKSLIVDITKWAVIYQTLRIGLHNDIDKNHLEYVRSSFFTYATLLMDIVDKSSKVEGSELVVEERDRLNDTLKKVVVYDVCRMLADFPVKEITRFIPTIPKKLEKENQEYYLDYSLAFESLVTSTLEGYKQPKANLLKHRIVDADMYKKRKKILRFLILIENIGKKELLSFERDLKGCQIEHIMPQTLPLDGWGGISETNHEKYLHTLGNLSITYDNQNLSNKSFNEKKLILSEKSRINLNQGLLKYEVFDEKAIQERTLELLNIFVNAYGLKYEYDVEYNKETVISMTIKNISAHGFVKGTEIVVNKGSEAVLLNQSSIQEKLKSKKKELIQKGVLVEEGDVLIFSQDCTFSSYSMAAGIIAGASVNGKRLWKSSSGYTISELSTMVSNSEIDEDTLVSLNKIMNKANLDTMLS